MHKVVSALSYLHSKGIAHRDIKLANLVYANEGDDADVKLIDFGLSRKFRTQEEFELMQTFVGTPSYMAPEVADRTIEYNAACDMWSVGVAAYLLMCGKYPHSQNKSPFHQREEIKNYKVDLKFPSQIRPTAKDWIKKLLVKDPAGRMSAAQALKHPWLKQAVEVSPSAVPKGVVDSLVHFAKQSAIKRVRFPVLATRVFYSLAHTTQCRAGCAHDDRAPHGQFCVAASTRRFLEPRHWPDWSHLFGGGSSAEHCSRDTQPHHGAQYHPCRS